MLRDARVGFLVEGGRIVPSVPVFVAPVTFQVIGTTQSTSGRGDFPSSIDVSAAKRIAANAESKYDVVANDVVALAAGQELTTFPSDHEERMSVDSNSWSELPEELRRIPGLVRSPDDRRVTVSR